MRDHVRVLRRKPNLRNAFIVFIPENNLAFEAQNFAFTLTQDAEVNRDRFIVMEEDANREGIRNDYNLKLSMATSLKRFLTRPDTGRIVFHKDFFTIGRYGDIRESEAERVRIQFVEQLRSYTKIIKPPSDALKKPTVTFTGKHTGKPDDLCIAAQLTIHMAQRFYTSGKYRAYRDESLRPTAR